MNDQTKLLILEDGKPGDGRIEGALRKAGISCQIHSVFGREEFIREAQAYRPDVIFLDIDAFGQEVMTAFEKVRTVCPGTPVIMVGQAADETAALDLIRKGAADYLVKDRLFCLSGVVERVLASARSGRSGASRGGSEEDQPFKILFDGAVDGMVLADTETKKFILCNRMFTEMLGYTSDEIKALSVYDIHAQEDLPRVLEGFEQQVRGEKTLVKYSMVKRKDGTVFYADINSVPVMFSGKPCLLGTFRDTSEQKRMEDEFRKSQERYQRIVTTANEGIFVLDRNHRITYSNETLGAMLGYDAEELLGKPVESFIYPEDMQDHVRQMSDRSRGTKGTYERRLVHKDGAVVWTIVSASPLLDAYGDFNGSFAMITDITARKHAEDQARRVAARQEALLASVPDIIAEVDIDRKYVWMNKTGLDFFGQEAIGREAAFYFEGEQKTYDTVSTLFEGAEDVIYVESWQRRKDGVRRLLGWWCRVLKDQNGNVVGALSTARDITESKKAETALVRTGDRLSRVSECLSSLGTDYQENIRRITILCGEIFEASCALYNRLEGGLLCSLGQWNAPADLVSKDQPEGHICYDVIRRRTPDILVVQNLPESSYASSDPNVGKYKLKTYVGRAVFCGDEAIGSLCVVSVDYFMPTEEDKRVLNILASALSVEEDRRRINERLCSAEIRLTELIENMKSGVITYQAVEEGKDFIIKSFNRAGEHIDQVRREDIIGKKVTEAFPGVVRSGFLDTFKRVWETGKPEKIPTSLYKDDRIAGWRQNYVYRLPSGEVVAVYDDVTERKKTEDELSKNERRLRFALEASEIGIWEFDLLTGRSWRSLRHDRIFGYETLQAGWDFHRLFEHVISEDRPYVQRQMNDIMASQKTVEFECRIRRSDGAIRWIWTKSGPEVILRNQTVKLFGLVRDITDRKQPEKVEKATTGS